MRHTQHLFEAALGVQCDENSLLAQRQLSLLAAFFAKLVRRRGAVNHATEIGRYLHDFVDAQPSAITCVMALLAPRALAEWPAGLVGQARIVQNVISGVILGCTRRAYGSRQALGHHAV